MKSDRFKTTFAAAGTAVLAYWAFSACLGEWSVPVAEAQSDMYLSRRIDQVEQRFYSIESRLNRLEMEAHRPSAAGSRPPAGGDTEIAFLRSQLDALRVRVGEAECGLLKVDERTLTAAARAVRKRSLTGGTENCRLNSSTPVHLSARP